MFISRIRNLKYISINVSVSFAHFSISAERLAEDLNPSVPKMPSESASEGVAPKVT